MRAKDWSTTPVGPVENWPQSLRTVVQIMLCSRYAMWMGWGRERTFFYNDAYRPTLGSKHPWALGSPATEVWAEIWPAIGPRVEIVEQRGEATWDEGLLLFLERHGYPEETYHTFSYSPLPDDDGSIGGMLCVVTEETERVIGERRLRILREVATRIAATRTPEEVLKAVEERLDIDKHDLPFTLIYLRDTGDDRLRLAACTGLAPGIARHRRRSARTATRPGLSPTCSRGWHRWRSASWRSRVTTSRPGRGFERRVRRSPCPSRGRVRAGRPACSLPDSIPIGRSTRDIAASSASSSARSPPASRMLAPTRPSADGPRLSPSSTAPRPPSSRMRATNSARRSR